MNEALVWRLVEVWTRLDLASLSKTGDDKQVQASTDTPVQISLVYCSDLTAAVRSALSPAACLHYTYGLWISLLATANDWTLNLLTIGLLHWILDLTKSRPEVSGCHAIIILKC